MIYFGLLLNLYLLIYFNGKGRLVRILGIDYIFVGCIQEVLLNYDYCYIFLYLIMFEIIEIHKLK